jgi:hypothetical protein
MTIIHQPAYEDGTECSDMSAYKIQTLGNYPEENIQHTEHSKSVKSRKWNVGLYLRIIEQKDISALIHHKIFKSK